MLVTPCTTGIACPWPTKFASGTLSVGMLIAPAPSNVSRNPAQEIGARRQRLLGQEGQNDAREFLGTTAGRGHRRGGRSPEHGGDVVRFLSAPARGGDGAGLRTGI